VRELAAMAGGVSAAAFRMARRVNDFVGMRDLPCSISAVDPPFRLCFRARKECVARRKKMPAPSRSADRQFGSGKAVENPLSAVGIR
jgi:hypothetical protein